MEGKGILQPGDKVVVSPFPLAFLLSADKEGKATFPEGKATFPDLFPTRNFYFPAEPSTGKRGRGGIRWEKREPPSLAGVGLQE